MTKKCKPRKGSIVNQTVVHTFKVGAAGCVPSYDVSNIRMIAGNEKRISKVIYEGIVKEWVGIGWLDTQLVPDPDMYPVVYDPADYT